MIDKLEQIFKNYQQEIESADSLKELDRIFLALFGKTGELSLFPKDFAKLPKNQLKQLAPKFAQVKTDLEKQIQSQREKVKETIYKSLESETLDLHSDANTKRTGHLHPLTTFQNQIQDLFSKIGFSVYQAPHIDNDYYNFEALNIPSEHPARDLWDTLYIDKSNLQTDENLLLRTHTSNAQVRIMKEFAPPFRFMILDWCFRKENLDARHEHTFDQFEVVWVEKGLNMGHLQNLSEYFFKSVLGQDVKVRLRPKYYPFVEPGAGVDATCLFCKGEGCKTCGGIGWFELAGAGMIHPQVLRNGGIDPDEYSGIAWGVGLGRMQMLKLGIDDVRVFNSADLSLLEKIGQKENT